LADLTDIDIHLVGILYSARSEQSGGRFWSRRRLFIPIRFRVSRPYRSSAVINSAWFFSRRLDRSVESQILTCPNPQLRILLKHSPNRSHLLS
jgi:hypothetical protein